MSEVIEIKDPNISPRANNSPIDSISKVSSAISYDDFFSQYLVNNRPCIIDSEATGSWPCRRKWQLNGAPNFEYLRETFGQCTVPVADCRRKYYNSHLKNDMTMNDYLDYWRRTKESFESRLLYLKDWHCVKTVPRSSVYKVPKYFASDWLNEYYLSHPELNDDYMFIYMGPKGTWTPLHVDVFTSYSWSANIVGRKRWLLFPPGEENHLRDVYGQLAYDATSDELRDSSRYKSYDSENVKRLEVVQEAGEIMFVPSGWHHQVWNLEDTISVNHNWINANNISKLWNSLRREHEVVRKEIEDCRDMENWSEHCQVILRASYGMDYIQFLEFVSHIARKRLDSLRAKCPRVVAFDDYLLGANHCAFDLRQLRPVLEEFLRDSVDQGACKNDEATVLLNDIVTNLQSAG